MTSFYWKSGYTTSGAGKPRTACLIKPDRPAYQEWQDGYDAAEAIKAKNPGYFVIAELRRERTNAMASSRRAHASGRSLLMKSIDEREKAAALAKQIEALGGKVR